MSQKSSVMQLPQFVPKALTSDTAQLSAIIAIKLGIWPFDGKASQVPPTSMTSPTGEVAFDYSSHNGRYVIGSGMLETAYALCSGATNML